MSSHTDKVWDFFSLELVGNGAQVENTGVKLWPLSLYCNANQIQQLLLHATHTTITKSKEALQVFWPTHLLLTHYNYNSNSDFLCLLFINIKFSLVVNNCIILWVSHSQFLLRSIRRRGLPK